MTVERIDGNDVHVTWHNAEDDGIDRSYDARMLTLLTLVKCAQDGVVGDIRKKAA